MINCVLSSSLSHEMNPIASICQHSSETWTKTSEFIVNFFKETCKNLSTLEELKASVVDFAKTYPNITTVTIATAIIGIAMMKYRSLDDSSFVKIHSEEKL